MERNELHFIELRTLFNPEDAPDPEITGIKPGPDDFDIAPKLFDVGDIAAINPSTDPRDCKVVTRMEGDMMVRESYERVKSRLTKIPGVVIWD